MHDLLYMNYNSTFELLKQSLNKYSIFIFIGMYPLTLLLLYLCKKTINKIKENKIKLLDIIIFACSVFCIYFSTFYVLLATFRELLIIPVAGIIILGLYYIKDSIKDNIQNSYVYIAVISGITLLFLIPPFNIPDEDKHFVKSFKTSYFVVNDNGFTNLPVSIDNFKYKYTHGVLEQQTKYNGKNYFADMFEKAEYNKLSENICNYTNTKYQSVEPYLPSSIIIFWARIIGLSPLLLVLLGRFVDLLIVIILCYYAIKTIPSFEKVLFIVALFPIFLQQSAAINMDYLTNSIVIFLIAYIFYLKEKSDIISNKELILLSCVSIIFAFCKFGYFPILLLVLLIPNNKFKNKKIAIIMKSSIIIIPSIMSYIVGMSSGVKENTAYYTFSYALQHPIKTMSVYFDTALWRLDLDLFRGMFDGFGVSTKWNEPLILAIICIIYIILIAVKDNKDVLLNKKQKIGLLIICFAIIFIVYSAMFFSWTYLGAEVIDGLQPRYFIPAVVLLCIVLANDKIYLNVKNKVCLYTFAVALVHILSFVTILTKFY